MIAKMSESCVFLYLGVVSALAVGRLHWNFILIAFTVIVIGIARAAHIFPLSKLLNCSRGPDEKISRNLTFVLWISGLRGAIAFALSLQLPCTTGREVKRGQ